MNDLDRARSRRALEKLTAYNDADEAQHQELMAVVARWRQDHGAEVPMVVAECLDGQQRMMDRVAGEMQRLGSGAVALRDKWAASDSADLQQAAQELHALLCGKDGADA